MDPVPAQADATEPTTVPHAACRSLGRQPFRKKRREPALARREGGRGADSGSPMLCPRCGSQMKLVALITDPPEVRRILRHLLKIGRTPPGLDPSALN